MNHDSAETLYELQTGLTGPAPAPHPTHLATYTSERSDYTLGSGQTELRVPLTWTRRQGVTVTKTFIFRRGQYAIDLEYEVQNGRHGALGGAPYAQILRNDPPHQALATSTSRATRSTGRRSTTAPSTASSTPTSTDDSHLSLEVRDGWIAALQHHFVSAVVPPRGAPWHFTLGIARQPVPARRHRAALQTSRPAAAATFTQTLFVGPKLQAQLEPTAPELERVADYGRLCVPRAAAVLAARQGARADRQLGLAIIIVTFLLKLLFYPLSEASGRSMAKMKTLQPRIKNLQETYKDDREKLGRAMMELYQREKVNPVAGCLPMLIQIPVFLAFYWVLLESVEMRQAPFVGWINDLSSRDPFFILPAIMAVAMFVQYKLNPHAAGPGAGEGVHVHAARDVGDVRVLPRGPGAVLGHQHRAVDRCSSGTSTAASRRGAAKRATERVSAAAAALYRAPAP